MRDADSAVKLLIDAAGCESLSDINFRRDAKRLLPLIHPADSDTAIDEPWLRSVGFASYGEWLGIGFEAEGYPSRIRLLQGIDDWKCALCQYEPDAKEWDTAFAMRPVKTRGELRRLARVLGLTLNEKGGE